MKNLLKYKIFFENKQNIVRVAIISLLILAALFLFLFRTGNQQEEELIKPSDTESETTTLADDFSNGIIVDVAGEVVNPSVIELPLDSRINDAIQAAGGLTTQADISQVNRAAILSDGEKIFIPTKPNPGIVATDPINGGSTPNDGTNGITNGSTNGIGTDNSLVNINYSSALELQEVPGIGPVTSEKIIQYRLDHGLFRKLEDIKKVSGIGDKTYAKMKPYICI
jgi:competence protein ComEA